ncbi:hypothetical protein [Dactylosporangium sp. CA-233914]|uniref:hypothetical protein n=1 Tax=Dactylosporangium sp. CA-233914 TaxID=3239934 RepID=UPI003D8AB465
MNTYVFSVVLDRRPTDDEMDRLYDSGADDGAFAFERGVSIVEFDREAQSLADAIATAVRALEAAGLTPVRVLDEDLMTLADIADRIKQSRESVRRYVTGDRGPGGFPPPVNPARDGTLFYRWSEVAPWVREALGIDVADVDPALVVANLVLQARQLRTRVEGVDALTNLFAA